MHGLQQVDRGADAHQIPGQVIGEQVGGQLGEPFPERFRFAHGEAPDGESVERQARQSFRALPAEILEAGALHDAEERLGRVPARGEAACGPALGEVHRRGCAGVVRGRRDALIHRHHDVAADGLLDGDAPLGAQQDTRAVDVAAEHRALFGDRAVPGEGEHLESTRVGQHRAAPLHELVYAPETREHLGTGAEQQVVGVREQHGRAGCRQVLR